MKRARRRPRVILLANQSKPKVVAALRKLRPWVAERAEIVADVDLCTLIGQRTDWPQADVALVLGGDGTVLGAARQLVDEQIPIVGVNFGKLGFLAEFSLRDLKEHWEELLAGGFAGSARMVLQVHLFDRQPGDAWVSGQEAEGWLFRKLAMNDAVITAGEPHRMIEMECIADVTRDGQNATRFAGDGVIVATPSGSTAYNLSAGGPILSPELQALCITPICPHSLAFRPVVLGGPCGLCLRVNEPNPGTQLVLDGQFNVKLQPGQQVLITTYDKPMLLVHHPQLTYWGKLARKLHWAARPRSG